MALTRVCTHINYKTLLAMAVTVLSALIPVRADAQSCHEGNNDDWIGVAGIYIPGDDKLHITVRLDGSLTSAERAAASAAIDEWNAKSDISRWVFTEVSSGSSQDLLIRAGGSPNVCATLTDIGTVIRLEADVWAFAEEHPEWVQFIIAHELGHVLRLADTGQNWDTIMGNLNGDDCAAGVEERFASGNHNVTDDLASTAAACVRDFKFYYGNPFTPSSSWYPVETQTAPTCYDVWILTDRFTCGPNTCTYGYTEWVYWYSYCL